MLPPKARAVLHLNPCPEAELSLLDLDTLRLASRVLASGTTLLGDFWGGLVGAFFCLLFCLLVDGCVANTNICQKLK
jgi:hypothetical protein